MSLEKLDSFPSHHLWKICSGCIERWSVKLYMNNHDCRSIFVSVTNRGESKRNGPERRSGKRIIAGTAFRSEFLVGWYYDADTTMAVPELY